MFLLYRRRSITLGSVTTNRNDVKILVLGVRAVPVVIVLYIATSVVCWLSMKAKGCGQAG